MTSERRKRHTDYTGLLAAAIVLPLYFGFVYVGRPDTGKYICIGIALHLIAIRINWDLRRHVWFWATIAVLLAVHIPLLMIDFATLNWPLSMV